MLSVCTIKAMRNLREDRDLTQREVAQVINKSQQGYSHIEDGRAVEN